MKLKFQENIDKIDNCPVENEAGETLLFRLVEESLSDNSFLPHAILMKPKFSDLCNGWGLSLFSSYDVANSMLKSLTPKKNVSYAAIAQCVVKDSHGIKNCNKNKKHYTFFPFEDFEISKNFTIVTKDDN